MKDNITMRLFRPICQEEHMLLLKSATEIVVSAISSNANHPPTSSLSPYNQVVARSIKYLEETLKYAEPRIEVTQ